MSRLLFVCWCLLLPCVAWAEPPVVLRNLGVHADGRELRLGFDVELTDAGPLQALLARGEAVEVRVRAAAKRLRLGLWGEELGEAEYRARVQADPVRQECAVVEADGAGHTFPCADLERAVSRLWRHRDLRLGAFDPAVRQQHYEVRVEFRVVRSDMPAWVTVPLFFLDWDLVPRQRYELTFDY